MPYTEEPSTENELSPERALKLYRYWENEIRDALKREKKYREKAQKIVELFETRDGEQVPFNILYSNTETLSPAIYNSKPIPIVKRRYGDGDPLGKAASAVSQRTLKYFLDAESRDYDTFDELMSPAVLDGLITNRGLTRFKFVPMGPAQECVYGESVRWDKFFHGYSRTWKKVPWIGFEWDMSEAEIRKNFPNIPLNIKNYNSDEDKPTAETKEELTGVKIFPVHEVWDKRSGMVYFFSPCYTQGPLKIVPDPLGLTGFFPIPKPLNFMRKITTLIPTPLYEQYRSQAQELNDITRRLKAIIKAIKYRGAYNKAVDGIEKMLEADDNVLVPVENIQAMPDGTGMDKLLWIVPVQELAATAQQLYLQREQVKQVIYEITGISDILRGASVASETATAQNIKNQWGTLRLKRMQKEVQRYCRDCLTIMLEIAANKFEQQTFQAITGLPFLTMAAKQQLQMQMQMVGDNKPPPEVAQMLAAPTWEEIINVLHNEVIFHYKVDIETNSTIDAEAAQDKQDIADLLNALSQFLNGLGPLVQSGVLPFDIAKNMLLVVSRRYNFGSELEDLLVNLQTPPQQGDPNEEAKNQVAAIEAQAKLQEIKMHMQLEQQEFEHKKEIMQLEQQVEREALEIKRQETMMQMAAVKQKAMMQSMQHKQKMEQMKEKSEHATV